MDPLWPLGVGIAALCVVSAFVILIRALRAARKRERFEQLRLARLEEAAERLLDEANEWAWPPVGPYDQSKEDA